MVVVFKIFSLILDCQPHPQSPAAHEVNEFLSAFEYEYIQHNDVWFARQRVPARRGYAWWVVEDQDGLMEGGPVWRPPRDW